MSKSKQKPVAAALKVESVTLASLGLDPRNARKHGERNMDSIKSSLKRFGQQKPIVVDADGVIIAGNGTFAAAQSLGWTSIDVVRTKLRGAEARAFAIADNRTGELAEWDAAELRAQLDELEAEGFDLVNELAFTDADVDALLKETETAAGGGEGGKSGAGAGASAGSVSDQYKVVIDCNGDESTQTEILDAIDRGDGPRLAELVKGLECRALIG